MRSLKPYTSLPALGLLFALVTVLAMGPLRSLDDAAHGSWAKELTPGLVPFLDTVSDAIAGQAVCLPVLLVVALVAAHRHRSWRPLLVAGAAEALFYGGIGGIKLLLARTAPSTGDSGFFTGGFLEHGWHGMAYPSGHASEAVLIYGAAAYLVSSYWDLTRDQYDRLKAVVLAVTVHAVVVSFYLGFHWLTDLVGGVVGGALMLRVLVLADARVAGWVTDRGLDDLLRRPERERRLAPAADAAGASRGTLVSRHL